MKELKGIIIYPPNQLMDIETPRPDGSLGPLYLASSCQEHGIDIEILDASVGSNKHSLDNTFYRNQRLPNGLTMIGMTFEEIADYVFNNNFDFAAITSNFTPQTNMVINTAKALKKIDNKFPIFLGGINARAMYKYFLKTKLFEAICMTEGEIIFPMLIKNYFKDKNIRSIPGVSYITQNNLIISNPTSKDCFPKELDDLLMPSWEKLPFEKYEQISSPHGVSVHERKGMRYAPIMTSRGCPFRCAYCHISNETKDDDLSGAIGKLRFHSIDRVLDEISFLENLGVKRLFFEDDSLLANKKRVKTIFSEIKERDLLIANVNGVNLLHLYNRSKLKWEIDIEYLEILKNGGFDQIVFPVESGSQRVLQKYATNKVFLEKMNLPNLMKVMTEIGISAPVNMMIGFPDETEAEVSESIELAKKLIANGAPYVTFFIPIPFPGSALHKIAIDGGHIDPNFDPDMMNWKRPIMKNTSVSSERLEYIRDSANEDINNNLHLEKRLSNSMAGRWKSNNF